MAKINKKNMAVYAGARWQKGYGLGGIFGSLMRSALPVLKTVGKRAAKEVLRTGLEAGVGIASDALQGKNLKAAARARVSRAAANTVENVIKTHTQKRAPQKRAPQKRRRAPVTQQRKRRRKAGDIFDY